MPNNRLPNGLNPRASSAWIRFLAIISAAVVAAGAQAASPQLNRILPRGGQRGTEVTLSFEGARLSDAQEVFIYEPGITITKVTPDKGGQKVAVTAKIAPDARIGEYGVRLRTATGISEFRTFWVGSLPVIAEKEPNNDFKTPQAIPLNVSVAGVIDNEDQDFFVVEAKKGQRITAEIEGMRLGGVAFDPYVAILDEKRFELSASDDTALLKQDSVASIIAPHDGKYIIQVRESAFGGSADSYYRLHVGTFPRPRVVYPLGGQVGQKLAVKFIGDVKGTFEQTIQLPEKPDADFMLFAEQDGQTPPSGNHFRVVDFPNVMEVEPNDSMKTATAYNGPLPVAFNGIISSSSADPKTAGGVESKSASAEVKYQDTDYFKFVAKKGQVLEVNVYARRLRSPLDSVLTVYNSAGAQIATNDDSGGPDSYVRLNVPADGDYFVRVRDHLRAAGDQYAYRVEITPVQPAITMAIPNFSVNYSQERNAVPIPHGNLYATLIRIQRADVAGGPLALSGLNLPAGVKMTAMNIEPGVDTVPVLFEATPASKVSGSLVELQATPPDAKAAAGIHSAFKQVIELVTNGNQQAFYTASVDKMAVAVAEDAPYRLRIVQPKVPLVQGGEIKLKVIAERAREFTGPITVRFLFKPPGIEALAQMEIPANQNEADYIINASDGAPVKQWHVLVVGSGDANGLTWVASPFVSLDVAAPFLSAKIANATVEQAKTVKMFAELDVKTKWEGKAKAELVGLPGNTTVEAKEITAADTKIDFDVVTTKITPAAQHNGLFVRVTIMKDGEPIQHNVGRGAVLRVDAPLGKDGKPTTQPVKAGDPTKAGDPAKPKVKTEKPAK